MIKSHQILYTMGSKNHREIKQQEHTASWASTLITERFKNDRDSLSCSPGDVNTQPGLGGPGLSL